MRDFDPGFTGGTKDKPGALQRIAAHKLNPASQCLHVEIPTAVRRKMVLKLRSLEIESSLDASGL